MGLPESSSEVSAWRREPYRIFFPLGALLAWAGVLHWLLLATGVIDAYRPIFHAFAQVEGFMTCFAVGFLFTFIPRRTATAPPAAWQLGVAAAAPVMVVVAGWYEKWALSQAPWLVLIAVLIQFAVSRWRLPGARRRVPSSFVWVVLALAMGFCGAILAGIGGALGERAFWLHQVGSAMVLQGTFTGLVLGIGGMMIPVLTRGASPFEAGASTVRGTLLHLLAGAAFIASFFLEPLSVRVALGLRAAIVLAELLLTPQIWRWPSAPGLHRKLIWLGCWMMPLGYASVAAFPQYPKAGLHIVFIGCFAMLALTVGMHVVLSHGGASRVLNLRPWPVALMGALLVSALAMRVLFNVNPVHAYRWLGGAATAFLAATLVWTGFLWRSVRTA